MTKDEALGSVRMMARAYAGQVQEKAGTMSGTELYAEKTYIPDFAAAMEQKNMLERAAGFVCRALVGREQVQQEETQELIDRLFDGSADALFASLLGSKRVSEEQMQRLRRMIDEM